MLVIGHRGAASHEPENTLRSFRRALELGADMLEFDVRVCGSGEVVIIHDESVDRTTDGSGWVSEMGLNELRKLDAGFGERIPLLREVLEEFGGKIGLDIELKGPETAGPVSELISRFIDQGKWRPGGLMISSFRPEELLKASELIDGVQLGFLFEDHPAMGVGFARELGAAYVLPRNDLVDFEMMEMAANARSRVIAWTVNTRTEVERLTDLGVHGIITDSPEMIRI